MRFQADQVRKRVRDVLAAIDRVAELVQHRGHPHLVVDDVCQHAHVPFAVDVGAEGVWALLWLLVEIAAGQNILDRQTDARVKVLG